MLHEPRRHGARARRDGEVHVLRAAHRARAHRRARRRAARSATARSYTACAQACPAEAITFGNLNDRRRACRASTPTRAAYACSTSSARGRAPRYLARSATRTRSSAEHRREDHRDERPSRSSARRSSSAAPTIAALTESLARAGPRADAQGLVAAPRSRCSAASAFWLIVARHDALRRASARGATTSRSPGRSTSPTSSGGSASATPARSSARSSCSSSRSGAPRSTASPRR